MQPNGELKPAVLLAQGRHRAVFLDRDGVLTIPEFREGRSFAPRRLEDFAIYPEAPEAVSRLKKAGFLAVVVTNQPDVGAGFVDRSVVDLMHAELVSAVEIDRIEVCFETQANAPLRRKPGPGMLQDAAAVLDVDLRKSFMVGDRVSDIQAGLAAGCRASVFIDLGYTAELRPVEATVVVKNVLEAADWIIAQEVE